jgi:hypothetical protein
VVAPWSTRRWLLTAAGLVASLVLAAVIVGHSIVDHAEAPYPSTCGSTSAPRGPTSTGTRSTPTPIRGSASFHLPADRPILFVPMTRFTRAADYVWIAINVRASSGRAG